jgi:hypothetical protein
MIDGARQVAGH